MSISEKPQVLLVGHQGNGKTTLFNNLTGQNELTAFGGPAGTTEACIAQENQEHFFVIDTPGLGSLENRMKDNAALFASFKLGKISGIMFVVRYDKDDVMVKQIQELYSLFIRYNSLIIIAISYWDKVKKQRDQKSVKILQEKMINLINNKFIVQSIIFVSKKKEDQQSIRAQIYNLLVVNCSQGKNSEIIFSPIEIEKFFKNSCSNDQIQQALFAKSNDLEVIFQKKARSINKYIDSLKKQQNLENLENKISFICQYIKDLSSEEIKAFENDNKQYFESLFQGTDISNFYLSHTLLRDSLEIQVVGVVQRAQNLLVEKGSRFLNNLRQCPHCNRIWLKDNGCNWETFCGSVPSKEQQKIKKQQVEEKYDIVWAKDFSHFSLKSVETSYSKNQTNFEHAQNKHTKEDKMTYQYFFGFYTITENHTISEKAGCGQKFDWEKAKQIDLKELEYLKIDPKLIAYINEEDQRLTEIQRQSKLSFQNQFQKAVQEKYKTIKRLAISQK